VPQQPVYTVDQINAYLKRKLDGDPFLANVFIRGELSNYKIHSAGHHYFSMKDRESAINCVMFQRDAGRLRFRPENGMKVIALGRVTVFPRDGKYQFYVSQMVLDGVGDLHAAFEQMKARLASEGLFDPAHKKPLPKFPKRIALVTSPEGKAVRDMIEVLGKRWPLTEVVVVPCRVQGPEAAAEIAGAIAWVNALKNADLIITGRGGGSMEDLWCFNEEVVARAIYASEIPVISAVGHGPDVAISDYVADLRAATPSNAAELAVRDQRELRGRLDQLGRRLAKAMERQLQVSRTALERAGQSRILRNPMAWVDDRRALLEYHREKLCRGMAGELDRSRSRLGRLAASLDALSPLRVLGRGYAIARGPRGLVKSVKDVSPGEELRLTLSDGALACEVKPLQT